MSSEESSEVTGTTSETGRFSFMILKKQNDKSSLVSFLTVFLLLFFSVILILSY